MVSEISPERRYVCDSALTVDRTRDDGKSWRKLTKGLPQKNAYTQVLRHAATVNHCNNDGVYLGSARREHGARRARGAGLGGRLR